MFALEQLLELGLTAGAIRKRAATGRLHRVYRGVYSLVPAELLDREARWMAAVLACGPGAVLSHRSAASLLELRPTDRARIDVTVPARSARDRPGIDLHRSTTLRPADVTRAQNIPCTTVARTQLDIAEVIHRRGVERAFDQAEILEVFDLRALEEQLERSPHRRGAPVVRAVLAEHYVGSTPTWSEFEERFLAFIGATGLPQPEVNHWIVLSDGGPAIRADFAWPADRVIVETDGRRTHRTRQAFERDRRRDQAHIAAGYTVLRFTWRQLELESFRVVAVIATAIGAASRAA